MPTEQNMGCPCCGGGPAINVPPKNPRAMVLIDPDELATLRQRVAVAEAELKRMKGAIETFTNTVRYNGTRCIAPRWVGQDLHSSILPRATAPDAEGDNDE